MKKKTQIALNKCNCLCHFKKSPTPEQYATSSYYGCKHCRKPMNLKTFQQSELKRFEKYLLTMFEEREIVKHFDMVAFEFFRQKSKFFIKTAIEKAFALGKEETRKFILNEWEVKIDEVKDNLDEEYGEEHNYYPNYEGIFEDIIDLLKNK